MSLKNKILIFESIFLSRTLQAMGGNMTFREALHQRLSIIRPSLANVDAFNKQQMSHLTPQIE